MRHGAPNEHQKAAENSWQQDLFHSSSSLTRPDVRVEQGAVSFEQSVDCAPQFLLFRRSQSRLRLSGNQGCYSQAIRFTSRKGLGISSIILLCGARISSQTTCCQSRKLCNQPVRKPTRSHALHFE